MSQVLTLRRSPALRAGILGAVMGAAVGIGGVVAVLSLTPEASVNDSPARSINAAPVGFQQALQTHLVREYGTAAIAVGIDTQTALREHVLRENGLTDAPAGLGIDFASGLREHVVRENRSIVRAASPGSDLQQALADHVIRENR